MVHDTPNTMMLHSHTKPLHRTGWTCQPMGASALDLWPCWVSATTLVMCLQPRRVCKSQMQHCKWMSSSLWIFLID